MTPTVADQVVTGPDQHRHHSPATVGDGWPGFGLGSWLLNLGHLVVDPDLEDIVDERCHELVLANQ